MVYKTSKAVQETAVGDGLAVGLLSLGVQSIPFNKMTVEFAIQHAWRDWTYSAKFPQVRMDIDRNSLIRILQSAERRRGGRCGWHVGATLEPYVLSDGWDYEELGESAGSGFDLDLPDWQDLARRFLEEMKL